MTNYNDIEQHFQRKDLVAPEEQAVARGWVEHTVADWTDAMFNVYHDFVDIDEASKEQHLKLYLPDEHAGRDFPKKYRVGVLDLARTDQSDGSQVDIAYRTPGKLTTYWRLMMNADRTSPRLVYMVSPFNDGEGVRPATENILSDDPQSDFEVAYRAQQLVAKFENSTPKRPTELDRALTRGREIGSAAVDYAQRWHEGNLRGLDILPSEQDSGII